MQMPATLFDYIATLDIAIFLGLPLSLLIVVLLQEILAAREPTRPVLRGDFIRGNTP
jgi:hypothetical protein